MCLCDLGFTSDGINCAGGYNVLFTKSVKNDYLYDLNFYLYDI